MKKLKHSSLDEETMNYRQAKLKDIPQLVAMWALMMEALGIPGRKYDETEKDKCFATITRKLFFAAHYPYMVVVAEEGLNIVGFVSGGLVNYDYGADNLVTLEHIYVNPEFRNRGIAQQLGSMIEDWARNINADCIEIHVSPDKQPIWERFGYKPSLLTMHKALKGKG